MSQPDHVDAASDRESDAFARRHIGPRPDELAAMLAVIGVDSLETLIDQTVPSPIRSDVTPAGSALLDLPAARTEPEVLAALRELAAENRPRTSLIGMGYYGTHHAGRHPAQRAGEPGVVHGVHALPARDQPGAPGGAAQLPDDDRRAHRPGGGQRLAARRGDGRRRGDDAWRAACRGRHRRASSSITTPTRRRSPCCATRAEPVGIELVVGDVGRAGGRLLRGAVQPAHVHRCDRAIGARRSPRFTLQAASPSSPPTCSPARSSRRPASSVPTSPSARRSASACRWASAARTPRSSPPTPAPRERCRAGSSASARTTAGGRRSDWRCRRASSTSAVRRRRRTSVRHRCCSPTSPASTRAGTGPTASPPSPTESTVSPLVSPARSRSAATRCATTTLVRHDHRRRGRRRRGDRGRRRAGRRPAPRRRVGRRRQLRRDVHSRRRRPRVPRRSAWAPRPRARPT